jgi:hypothetical protein
MINLKRVKILGAYFTVACALQICLYLAMSISAERYQWLFYFNPRFGLYFVESVIKGEPPPPGIFSWVSAHRAQGRAADLANTFGDRVSSGEDLVDVLIQQKMIVAKMRTRHMPMKVLSLVSVAKLVGL